MTESYADDSQRFRLDSRIATGGMGEVWRATDTVLGRQVAVKLLKAEFADDPTFRSRFETEARHAAALHHPGVAGVYDVGESSPADGSSHPRPFLVMELVEGQPLSALIGAGPQGQQGLDPAAVRDLMAQVGDALGAAHAAGIIHRDVKPANLIVTPDGRVKVTDFGIARAADGVGITRTGAVMGTPQYLSPEQAEGKQATAASDVYALGVVAFECLTGRRPFDADSPVATALAHIREPMPDLPSSVPSDLAAVVGRAMAKDPAERYADGSAFAAALRDPATAVVKAAPIVPPVAPADDSHTQVMTPAAVVPVAGPPTSVTSTTASSPAGRRAWPVVAAVVLLVALAIVVTLLVTGGDDTNSSGDTVGDQRTSRTTSSPPTESSSEPSETTTSETTSEPATFDVVEGNYVGQPVDQVQVDLEAHDLQVQRNELDNDGTHDEGIVDSVNPTGPAEPGSVVTVGYWGPAPVEPPSTEPTTPTPPVDTTTPAGGTTGGLIDQGEQR